MGKTNDFRYPGLICDRRLQYHKTAHRLPDGKTIECNPENGDLINNADGESETHNSIQCGISVFVQEIALVSHGSGYGRMAV